MMRETHSFRRTNNLLAFSNKHRSNEMIGGVCLCPLNQTAGVLVCATR